MRHHLLLYFVVTLATLNARAQLNRAAVSVKGLDTNPCTPASPCRSFGQALSQTNAGGEIIAIDSGGYGPVAIDRSVSLEAAPGIYAGITVPFNADGINVNLPAPGKVVVRGLTLEGLSGGGNGIVFNAGAGGKLHIERCTINNFALRAIWTAFDTIITDTTIRGGGHFSDSNSMVIGNGATTAHVILDNVRVIDTNNGLTAFGNSVVSIRNSMSVKNTNYGFGVTSGSALNLDRCVTTGNGIAGIQASGAGSTVRVSNCTSTDNGIGMRANYSGTLETWQNNKVRGNPNGDVDSMTPVPGTITLVTQN
jgi:hypothetical protein